MAIDMSLVVVHADCLSAGKNVETLRRIEEHLIADPDAPALRVGPISLPWLSNSDVEGKATPPKALLQAKV